MNICPPDHKHDQNLTCYTSHACRCDRCRVKANQVNRARYKAKVYGRYQPHTVDATGTHRRLQALAVCGWSLAALADRLGIVRQVLQRNLRRPNTTADLADRVQALYDELWDRMPPEATRLERVSAAKARAWAARNGWVPPLAWDDDSIDDPAAVPDVGARERVKFPSLAPVDESAVFLAVEGGSPSLSPADRREVVRVLHARRWSDARIAVRAGCSERTVVRIREEIGLPGWAMDELEVAA